MSQTPTYAKNAPGGGKGGAPGAPQPAGGPFSAVSGAFNNYFGGLSNPWNPGGPAAPTPSGPVAAPGVAPTRQVAPGQRYSANAPTPGRAYNRTGYTAQGPTAGRSYETRGYDAREATPGAAYRQQSYRAPGAYRPVDFSGPTELSYEGRRVGTHGMVDAARSSNSYEGQAPQHRGTVGPLTGGMRNADAVTYDDGGGIQAASDQVYAEHERRLRPQLERQRQQTEQRLANQGIVPGSRAYNDEMDRLARAENDAMNQARRSADIAGRQEHSRQIGIRSDLRRQEYGERAADRAHLAGEAGRSYRERLASRQFQAGEAARGYAERADQARFTASERGRDYQERQQSEDAYFGKRHAGDVFRANQAARRDSMAVDQAKYGHSAAQRASEFGATHDAGERRYSAGLAERQRQHDLAYGAGERRFEATHGAGERRFRATHDEGMRRYDDAAARGDRQFEATHGAAENARESAHYEGQRRYDDAAGRGDRQFRATFTEGQRQYDANYGLRADDQNYRHRLASAGFESGEAARGFNEGQAARAAHLNEYNMGRQAPFQQLTQMMGLFNSLLGGTAPGQPTFYGTPGVDHSGNVNANTAARVSMHNQPGFLDHLAGIAGQFGGGWLAGRA